MQVDPYLEEAMGLLLNILGWLWFGTVMLLGFGSMALSVLGVRIGLRDKYLKVLMFVFDWARQRHLKQQLRRGSRPIPGNQSLIKPEAYRTLAEKCASVASAGVASAVSFSDILDDSLDMTKWGVEVIVTDEVTSSFDVEELTSWNLLTRTDRGHNFVSWRLTFLWAIGWGIAILGALCIAPLPEGPFQRGIARHFNIFLCRILMRAVSLSVTFHNEENMAKRGGICVANHTSFMDFMLLGSQNQFSIIGQRADSGFPKFTQTVLSRISGCEFFERESASDRSAVKRAMMEHAKSGGLPILVFPEGVCVNNINVMRFRKGSFELGVPIYPVAIKYDRRFGEAFWHQDTWYEHLLSLTTSWAIKADVYYLPVMQAEEGEDPIEFARRVKETIALYGGFIDVNWDGYLKFFPVREEKIFEIKRLYSERVKKYDNEAEEYLSAAEE